MEKIPCLDRALIILLKPKPLPNATPTKKRKWQPSTSSPNPNNPLCFHSQSMSKLHHMQFQFSFTAFHLRPPALELLQLHCQRPAQRQRQILPEAAVSAPPEADVAGLRRFSVAREMPGETDAGPRHLRVMLRLGKIGGISYQNLGNCQEQDADFMWFHHISPTDIWSERTRNW